MGQNMLARSPEVVWSELLYTSRPYVPHCRRIGLYSSLSLVHLCLIFLRFLR